MNNIKSYIYLFVLLTMITACSHYLTKEQNRALAEIIEILNTTIAETEEIMSRQPDPTSPYRNFKEKLRKIQNHIDSIKAGKESYNPEIISQYSNEILEIRMNVQNPVNRVLGVDVFFGPGKYKISDFSIEGKDMLNSFAADIIELQVKKLREFFPDKQLAIVIKSIGYSDEMPFSRWFAEELKKDINISLPEAPLEKRKILNRELSFRRARSIGKYLKMQVKRMLDVDGVIIAEPVIIGLGETFPYTDESVVPPYKAEDKRRRICKIHGNVFVTSH
ncbi:hypothetical protein DENIS_2520 [Desulfonema ishimotonii]|uniref:OmpA-like domain-containing protein n=1 Tax=Desulfonema ishimotonii TaxID=45657 RepID=A0A401FX43_9BACT|nr:hypothetical protein [Desulfonema ishimotonii]GBC61558.1 hypothetical protein DENIS_2520 [Desulfonema ishimotonii]